MTRLESLRTAQEAARGAMDQEGDFVTQSSHAAWVAASEAYTRARQDADYAELMAILAEIAKGNSSPDWVYVAQEA